MEKRNIKINASAKFKQTFNVEKQKKLKNGKKQNKIGSASDNENTTSAISAIRTEKASNKQVNILSY